MSSTTPQAPPPMTPPAPAKKKTSPIIWILVGCAGIILILAVMFMLGVGFLVHKGKQYVKGAEKNPALAAAKLAVAVNPELELVSSDDEKGTLTIRNKKTGETLTMDASDIKAGKLRFKNEKGETVEFAGSGEKGHEGLTIKGDKGEMAIGANAEVKAPDWVPMYPGSKPVASLSKKEEHGLYGNYNFPTSDSADVVLSFYEKALKQSGFAIEKMSVASGMGTIEGKSESPKREIHVSVAGMGGQNSVQVQYEEKQKHDD